MSLNNYTDVELKKEIKKRQHRRDNKPMKLVNPDFSVVVKYAEKFIESLVLTGCGANDAKHYIFESTMEAVYGEDIWEYINKL